MLGKRKFLCFTFVLTIMLLKLCLKTDEVYSSVCISRIKVNMDFHYINLSFILSHMEVIGIYYTKKTGNLICTKTIKMIYYFKHA